jgi:hypothetical protein
MTCMNILGMDAGDGRTGIQVFSVGRGGRLVQDAPGSVLRPDFPDGLIIGFNRLAAKDADLAEEWASLTEYAAGSVPIPGVALRDDVEPEREESAEDTGTRITLKWLGRWTMTAQPGR